jgi:plasmid stabilization system protein ParE
MSRRIILSPDARADLDAAGRWYRRKEIGLSHRFRAEIRTSLLRVAQYPYASLWVDDLARRVLTNRFRYRIDFNFDANTVLVLAITHQRRQDTVWKDRIDEFKRRRDD